MVKVSDSVYGGTYITVLNSVNNLGLSWFSSVSFFMLDFSTIRTCKSLSGTAKEGVSLALPIFIFLNFINVWAKPLQKLCGLPISLPSWQLNSEQTSFSSLLGLPFYSLAFKWPTLYRIPGPATECGTYR